MNAQTAMLLAAFAAALALVAWPLVRWIDAVMAGRFAWGRRVEAPLLRWAGVKPEEESGWLAYATGLLVFNGLGLVAVYALQRLQGGLPLNPQALAAVSADSATRAADFSARPKRPSKNAPTASSNMTRAASRRRRSRYSRTCAGNAMAPKMNRTSR